ncbi:hypothetical protein GCM10023340_36070 [Nocardioides marinquilinus]|uniref:GP-PDE domain-containing protein n=1 Tax=Nocardioides marinquilinus TaxID=1210400 RepID=A0ABP9PX85_9ACTN
MVSRNRTALAGALAALLAVPLLTPSPAQAAPTGTTRPERAERPERGGRPFDLQAHRGGLGLTVESTLAGFDRALRLGVSTLELDVQITEDGRAVVTHDRQVQARTCADTAPATAGDPEWPYVGTYVNTLSLDQVRTLDCGSRRLPAHPGARLDPGARMPLLSEVLDLVRAYEDDEVMLNIETKVEAGAPSETAPREQFVQVTAAEVDAAGLSDQVSIQSFDWGALMRMREVAPELPIVALTNRDFLQAGQPGASPWLGGIDIDDFGGDLVAAAASFDADAISPVHGFPQDGAVDDADYEPYVTRAMVRSAHRAGLRVVPWTVDDVPTMRALVGLGVDGLITDYPNRLRRVLAETGHRLPPALRPPSQATALPAAHAHNDYEHARPLRDAIEQGFTSVEADVWLVDGELLVAHDLEDVVPGRTLESLYLSPLEGLAAMNRGPVIAGHRRPLQLLVDVKSEASATYAALDRVLRRHPRLLTSWDATGERPGAVSVAVSGNRDLPAMAAQPVRWAAYDGRLENLYGGASAGLVPLISANWSSVSAWTGTGPFPAADRARLRRIVEQAHDEGRRVRFWATNDSPGAARRALWTELRRAGVDHLNTDDLSGLRRFLTRR